MRGVFRRLGGALWERPCAVCGQPAREGIGGLWHGFCSEKHAERYAWQKRLRKNVRDMGADIARAAVALM